MSTSSFTRRAAVLAALVAIHANAGAQQTQAPDWQYEAGPLVWATSVSGYMRPSPGAPVAHFNDSASNLRLNAAIFQFEAGLGPWGVLAAAYSIDQSQDSQPLQHGQPGKTMPDGTYNIGDLAGLYRLSTDPDMHFDLLAGIRYSSLDMDVNQPASVAQVSCLKCHHNEHWTDGIVGFRASHRMGQNWWLDTYGDIGAGGSKTTWQGLIGFTYQVDEGITAKFGYRALSMDYEITRLQYNLKTSGIYAGIAMRF